MQLAWGSKVSAMFREGVIDLARFLKTNPDWLMSAMAFETGESFRSDIVNAAGSGAIGLIQFMPQTAALLGTTTEELAQMRPEDQLKIFVRRYFQNYAGRLNTLSDVYMTILWPRGVGKPEDYILFDTKNPNTKLYLQNKGLDIDKDGDVEKQEAAACVARKLAKGLQLPYLYDDSGSTKLFAAAWENADGDLVRDLQKLLGIVKADGKFGPKTAEALQNALGKAVS